MNDFGNFLYSLRKGKGMTQQELADRLVGNPEPLCKFALRQIARFARSLNERSDFDLIHSVTS